MKCSVLIGWWLLTLAMSVPETAPEESRMAEMLKLAPAWTRVMCFDGKVAKILENSKKEPFGPLKQLKEWGVEEIDRFFIASQDTVANKGVKGGYMLAAMGRFDPERVGRYLVKEGRRKGANIGSFSTWSDNQSSTLLAVNDTMLAGGRKVDIDELVKIRKGRMGSAFSAPGVQDALKRAGEGGILSLTLPSRSDKDFWGWKFDLTVLSFNELKKDKSAKATLVALFPDASTAEKEAKALQKRFESGKMGTGNRLLSIEQGTVTLVAKLPGEWGALLGADYWGAMSAAAKRAKK